MMCDIYRLDWNICFLLASGEEACESLLRVDFRARYLSGGDLLRLRLVGDDAVVQVLSRVAQVGRERSYKQ